MYLMFDGKFKLFGYNDALAHTLVVNLAELHHYTWVEIPQDISRDCSLVSIEDVFNADAVEIDISTQTLREHRNMWIRINTSALDTHVGMHMYKFTMMNSVTLEDVYLYLTYRIQTDDLEKPYIYMERSTSDDDSEGE